MGVRWRAVLDALLGVALATAANIADGGHGLLSSESSEFGSATQPGEMAPRTQALCFLAHKPASRWTASLVHRYKTSLPHMQVIVVLSLAAAEAKGTVNETISSWQQAVVGAVVVPVHSVEMQAQFPKLAIMKRAEDAAEPSGQRGAAMTPAQEWAWGHHETSLLMVPGIQHGWYKYVWVVESDVVFMGDLRAWGGTEHWRGADLVQETSSLDSSNWVHRTQCGGSLCDKPQWSSWEHVRRFSSRMLSVLRDYYAKGDYLWGEAFAPSVCEWKITEPALDCRNASLMGKAKSTRPDVALTPQDYQQLTTDEWHHGFADSAWQHCEWPDASNTPSLDELCRPDALSLIGPGDVEDVDDTGDRVWLTPNPEERGSG